MNEQYAKQAMILLRIGFVVAPILAGVDKFVGVLADWDKYLAPFIPNLLGTTPEGFMMIVGAVEIIAGVVVAVKPQFGGWLVAVWLVGIIINLVIVGGYLDIALRDVGLCLGAISLALLARGRTTIADA